MILFGYSLGILRGCVISWTILGIPGRIREPCFIHEINASDVEAPLPRQTCKKGG